MIYCSCASVISDLFETVCNPQRHIGCQILLTLLLTEVFLCVTSFKSCILEYLSSFPLFFLPIENNVQCHLIFSTGFYIYGKTWKLHVNKIPKHIILWPYTALDNLGTWTKAVLSPANLAWLFGRLMCFPIISLLFNVFPYY